MSSHRAMATSSNVLSNVQLGLPKSKSISFATDANHASNMKDCFVDFLDITDASEESEHVGNTPKLVSTKKKNANTLKMSPKKNIRVCVNQPNQTSSLHNQNSITMLKKVSKPSVILNEDSMVKSTNIIRFNPPPQLNTMVGNKIYVNKATNGRHLKRKMTPQSHIDTNKRSKVMKIFHNTPPIITLDPPFETDNSKDAPFDNVDDEDELGTANYVPLINKSNLLIENISSKNNTMHQNPGNPTLQHPVEILDRIMPSDKFKPKPHQQTIVGQLDEPSSKGLSVFKKYNASLKDHYATNDKVSVSKKSSNVTVNHELLESFNTKLLRSSLVPMNNKNKKVFVKNGHQVSVAATFNKNKVHIRSSMLPANPSLKISNSQRVRLNKENATGAPSPIRTIRVRTGNSNSNHLRAG